MALSRLVSGVDCGIRLYRLLIVAYSSTFCFVISLTISVLNIKSINFPPLSSCSRVLQLERHCLARFNVKSVRGQMIDIMNDHDLEHWEHVSTREKNAFDLILISPFGHYQ